MKIPSDEAKRVVKIYYSNGSSPTLTFRHFNNWALQNNCATRITKKNVIDLIKRFELHTDIQKLYRRKPSMLQDEDVLSAVINSIYNQRGKSLRKCASENGLSLTTTQRAARHTLKLYPYRLILVQALSFYDKIVRVEACHRLLEILETGIDVVYTDEASFRTDGHVNTWNCRIWEYDRPDSFVAETIQSAKQLTIWGGMSRNHLFGPYFFPSTVTGDSYRAIISEMFIPDILQKVGSINDLWFQQDGAPAHTANDTKAFLRSQFDERLISRGLHHEWPPRSPDLTPCDFYLWGIVKDLTFQRGPFSDTSAMQNAIIDAFQTIRHLKIANVSSAVMSVPRRMQRCIALEGGQLQHQ
jgi:hypothetical protein